MVLICYGWEEICLHMWSLRECMKIDSLKSRNEIYKSGEASDSLCRKVKVCQENWTSIHFYEIRFSLPEKKEWIHIIPIALLLHTL